MPKASAASAITARAGTRAATENGFAFANGEFLAIGLGPQYTPPRKAARVEGALLLGH